MWTSANFKTYTKQFDFTSSGQGKVTYTALTIGGTDFMNMVEALEGEIDDNQIFQTIICDHCGTFGCASGNWVALRQMDDFIFFIPAFEALLDDPTKGEYEPPYLLRQKGAYWLTAQDYEAFKKLVPALDKQKSIKKLTASELTALYVWEAPVGMFDQYPDANQLDASRILHVTELEPESIISIIKNILNKISKNNNFEINFISKDDNLVSIFVDDAATTEWKALCATENGYVLSLGGVFKIVSVL